MRKTLYIISLSVLVFSCTSKKNIKKNTYRPKTPVTQTKTVTNSTSQEKIKPQITKESGVEFFTTNIADITKNDNTASYGSIVSQNLPVTK